MKKLPKKTADGSDILSIKIDKNLVHGVVKTKRGNVKPVLWCLDGTHVSINNSNLNIEL